MHRSSKYFNFKSEQKMQTFSLKIRGQTSMGICLANLGDSDQVDEK